MQAWLQGVGWVSENDWYRKGETVASKSLWKMRRGGHSAWLGKEKKWAHWVILACFQLHELKSWVQVQCIILEPVNKIPLCSPVKLISEELHYFLWDTALQMCRGSPAQLHCLCSTCKNGHSVLGWAENDTCSSDPHWGYQVGKTSCIEEEPWAVDVCVILFCSFVNLLSYL